MEDEVEDEVGVAAEVATAAVAEVLVDEDEEDGFVLSLRSEVYSVYGEVVVFELG